MTTQEAKNYVKSALQMVMDDDYPDVLNNCVGELVDFGFSFEEATEIVENYQKNN